MRQQVLKMDEARKAELNLMKDRINDLTGKLSATEKDLRQARENVTQSTPNNNRLSTQTKGPDFGGKLQELQSKINSIKQMVVGKEKGIHRHRKSSSTLALNENHSMLVRLHQLSASVRQVSDSLNLYCDTTRPQ